MAISRFSSDGAHGDVLVDVQAQDAFLVIFQLRDHPRHEHWSDGKPTLTRLSPAGCLHIADLSAAPSARLTDPFDSLHFHVPAAALEDIAEEAGAASISGLRAQEPWITPDPIIGQMQPLLVSALAQGAELSSLFRDHLALATVSHLATAYGGLTVLRRSVGGLAPWQEKRAREAIAADLSGRTSLNVLAAQCGLSPAHFAKSFKASTGETPHGWLQARRVDAAREMLRGSGRALSEIADACGFADQSHFSRVFKRAAGASPAAWRRLRRSGPAVMGGR